MIEVHTVSSTPPIRCWCPYGNTITSPRSAQCGSPPSMATQHLPLAMMWK
jgi:hypothetical protein